MPWFIFVKMIAHNLMIDYAITYHLTAYGNHLAGGGGGGGKGIYTYRFLVENFKGYLLWLHVPTK